MAILIYHFWGNICLGAIYTNLFSSKCLQFTIIGFYSSNNLLQLRYSIVAIKIYWTFSIDFTVCPNGTLKKSDFLLAASILRFCFTKTNRNVFYVAHGCHISNIKFRDFFCVGWIFEMWYAKSLYRLAVYYFFITINFYLLQID